MHPPVVGFMHVLTWIEWLLFKDHTMVIFSELSGNHTICLYLVSWNNMLCLWLVFFSLCSQLNLQYLSQLTYFLVLFSSGFQLSWTWIRLLLLDGMVQNLKHSSKDQHWTDTKISVLQCFNNYIICKYVQRYIMYRNRAEPTLKNTSI